MRLCTSCHKIHDDKQRFCTGCGAALPVPVDRSAQAESEHIGYLLGEIPGWTIRHLVTREAADTLRHEYTIRRDAILGTQPAAAAPPQPAPVAHSTVAPVTAPPVMEEPGPPPVVQHAAGAVADAALEAPPVASAGPPERAWVAGFLEAHWVKLLATLGIALTFAGMKQVLGWEWVNQMVLALIPCLPIALCVVPLAYGIRAYRPGVLGPVAWCVVGAWMGVFAVGSVNKHWLQGAIAAEWCYAGGFALATLITAGCLRRCVEPAFLHSSAISLVAGVFALMRGLCPSDIGSLTPMWAYSGVALALAGIFALLAYAAREESENLPEGSGAILLAWAHVCTSLALARAVWPILNPGAEALVAWWPILAATVLYVVISSAFVNSGIAYAAGAFSLLTAHAYLSAADRLNWHSGATAALVIGFASAGIALAFRQANEGSEARRELVPAYSRIAVTTASLAGLVLLARILWAVVDWRRADLVGEWPTGAGVALACAVAFVLMAVYYRRSAVLYAAAVAVLPACMVATDAALRAAMPRWVAPLPILPVPYALACAAAGLLLLRRTDDDDRPDWGAPPCHAALAGAALVACMAPWWVGPHLPGGRPALWAGFTPAMLVAWFVASAALKRSDVAAAAAGVAQAATAAAAVTAIACLAPQALGQPPQGIAVGLALVSALSSLGAAAVGRDEHPWSSALRIGSVAMLVGAACAAIVEIQPLTGAGSPVGSYLWGGFAAAALGYAVAASLPGGARAMSGWLLGFGLSLMWWCYSVQSGLRGAWVAVPCGVSVTAWAAAWYASAVTRLPGYAGLGAAGLLVSVVFALCEGHGSLVGLHIPAACGAVLAVGLAGMLLRTRADEWWGLPTRYVAYGAALLLSLWLPFHAWDARPQDAAAGALSVLALGLGAALVAVILRSGPWSWLATLAITASAAAGGALIHEGFSSHFATASLVLAVGAGLSFVAASALKLDDEAAEHALPLMVAGAIALVCAILVGWSDMMQGASWRAQSPVWIYAASVAMVLGASLLTRLPDRAPRLWCSVGLMGAAFVAAAFQHTWGIAGSAALAGAGLVVAATAGRVAWDDESPAYAHGMAGLLVGVWLVLVHRVALASSAWDATAAAGGLALAAIVWSGTVTGKPGLLADGCRRSTGVAIAFLAVLMPYAGWAGPNGITPDEVAAGALLAVGATWVALARSSGLWVGLLSGTLIVATYMAAHWRSWSCPAEAALLAGLAAAMIALGDLRGQEDREGFRRAAWISGAALSALAGLVALVTANTPDEGRYSVLALALFGSVYAALYIRKQGDGFAHVSFVGFFLAYAITLYDRIHFSADVLDFYLLPVGLYLIAAGDVTDKRGAQEGATALWTTGCLTVLTPAFASFLANNNPEGNPIHSMVLLIECSALLIWGIAARVRAFVLTGASFLLLCALVLGIGAARQVWSGLFALLLGLGMLGLVTYITVKREELQAWMLSAKESWGQWR